MSGYLEDCLISVIVPCYNVESYIRRCLDSILGNSYRKIQVICVDDGSQDATLEILQSYVDDRLTVISQANAGVSVARNKGLSLAKGDFICFIDPDDWVHNEYFARLIAVALQTKASVVACQFIKTEVFCEDVPISKNKVSIGPFSKVFGNGLLKDVVWGRLYSKDFVGNCRFKDNVSFSEDKLFNAQFLLEKSDALCAVIETPLYYYFMRENSAIHTFDGSVLLPVAEEFKKFGELSKDDNLTSYFIKNSVNIALSARYLSMFRTELSEYNRSCDDFLKKMSTFFDRSHSLFSFDERLRYRLFIKIPFLYRIFRIAGDKTLLEWERNEKQNYRTK